MKYKYTLLKKALETESLTEAFMPILGNTNINIIGNFETKNWRPNVLDSNDIFFSIAFFYLDWG